MIDLYIGGACPRRSLTYALPRALICPSAPLDAPLPGTGLSVTAAFGSAPDVVQLVAEVAAQSCRPWLAALFEDHSSTCNGILLVRPVAKQVHVVMVHPFIASKGAPMILVSACARWAFAVDEDGEISDVPPPKRAKASAGADRGWAELKRLMKASTQGHSFWPRKSWELQVA